MPRPSLRFNHVVIDPNPPGSHHDITLLADLTGNGRNDVIIGCKSGPINLFWYENPGWQRHDIARAPNLEAGGALVDISGNGRLDIVAGQQAGGHKLSWFEQPPDPRQPWPVYTIEDRFEKYHDQAAGDVDGDGRAEIVAISQVSGVVMYYDIPDDPRVSPWPRSCCHVIARDMYDVEGLAIVDIDHDGRVEIIAGPNILRPPAGDEELWRKEPLPVHFARTRVAVGDLDGDGRPEIVLGEGESYPGRLAWLSGPPWQVHMLAEDLFHPHSLQLADFDGDGNVDMFVAEMGLGKNPRPRAMVFLNRGGARFEQIIVEVGVPTHEAKIGDLTGDGRPDIVGKPYTPQRHIDAWINET